MTTRALVLGGGGVTGVAWATGLLVGLLDAGIDLRDADLVVGTSAGSVVGAQLATGADLRDRYAVQLAGTGSELPAELSRATLLRFGSAMLRSRRNPEAFRARVGRYAMTASSVPVEARLDVIADRLPVHEWPVSPRLVVTAVDAQTGVFTTFSRDDGVPLVDAVAASCAVPGVWPPVPVAGRPYLDGGLASPANCDVAAGHDRIVVIAPLVAGIGLIPGVARQVAELEQAGSRVVVVSPDAAATTAIGKNTLDPAQRPAAARAGLAQAASTAPLITAVWTV